MSWAIYFEFWKNYAQNLVFSSSSRFGFSLVSSSSESERSTSWKVYRNGEIECTFEGSVDLETSSRSCLVSKRDKLWAFVILWNFVRRTQWWKDVPLGPPDIILGIFEAFKVDTNPNKIDLSVGAYRDEIGRPYVLRSILKAEQNIVDKRQDKTSDSDIGSELFRNVTFRLAVGDKLFSRPHVSVQVSFFSFSFSSLLALTCFDEKTFRI